MKTWADGNLNISLAVALTPALPLGSTVLGVPTSPL